MDHTTPQLLTGARGQIKINNGAEIAFVTDVNVTINANVRPVHTFGAVNARSVEPLSYSVSASIGRVIPVNTTTGAAVNTSDMTLNIEKAIGNMLTAEDITLTLFDKIKKQVIADIRHCRFAGRSLGLSAQQIAQGRIQLVGIYDAAGGNVADPVGL